MKYAVTIVSPRGYPHAEAFREVAETLHFGLQRLGLDSVLTTELSLPGRTHLVLGSNLLAKAGQAPAPGSVLYNLEQISVGSPWLSPALLSLLRQYPVWDYSQRNLEQLAALGIVGARHVPLGYVPELSRIAPAPEDIDVLFFGSVNQRRLQVLTALEARGLKVHAVFGVYGAARDALIARAKVVLNLHFYAAKVFEIVRVSYLLANRRFVVSERGADAGEEAAFADGVAFAAYEELVETCAHFVARPQERARLAAAGQALFQRRPEEAVLAEALQLPTGEVRLSAGARAGRRCSPWPRGPGSSS